MKQAKITLLGNNWYEMDTRGLGICPKSIKVQVVNRKIEDYKANGGCKGNSQAVANLLKGMDIDEAIKRLKDIKCGEKATSCSAQLSYMMMKISMMLSDATKAHMVNIPFEILSLYPKVESETPIRYQLYSSDQFHHIIINQKPAFITIEKDKAILSVRIEDMIADQNFANLVKTNRLAVIYVGDVKAGDGRFELTLK